MNTSLNKPKALIADIGGTNARFALAYPREAGSEKVVGDIQVYKTERYPGFADAAEHYIGEHLDGQAPPKACFAFACPVEGDSIDMTNNHWSFTKKSISERLGIEDIRYVNDFQANALSLLDLRDSDLLEIGKAAPGDGKGANENFLFLGPGTGLGVCILCRRGDRYFTLPTEGGHSSFAPKNALQMNILEFLLKRYDHVSNERLLAGPGIMNLYAALAEIQGQAAVHKSNQEIVGAAKGGDELAKSTIRMFFNLLASVSSNLAISSGCTAGVYLTSDIILKNLDFLDGEEFRSHFNKRGRFSDYMAKIPIYCVQRSYLGLIGASVAVNHPNIH